MTFRIAFYKTVPPGWRGLYNRLIRWWDQSPYSHVELIFSDGAMASSSWMDGGVRIKTGVVPTPGHWDIFDLPPELEPAARAWFEQHKGQPYDLWTQLHFVWGPIRDDRSSWFCSEACAGALGFSEPWRFSPGALATTYPHYKPITA